MATGGYRQPSSPAPVSGPGSLSRRTDGGPGGGGQPMRVPTGGRYGEASALADLQRSAPLGASPGGVDMPAPPERDITADLVPMDAPTAEPGTPITAGASLGAGPGLEALGLPDAQGEDIARLKAWLPVFEHMADQPGSSRVARNLVRQLKGM